MTPIELRQRGYKALLEALGLVDAILFLQQAGWGTGDYTKERQQWLAPVTRKDFWEDIQQMRARESEAHE
ncbi:MAG: hypothetical protein SNJ57_02325 [Cyanobacteriota bacterium]